LILFGPAVLIFFVAAIAGIVALGLEYTLSQRRKII